MAQTRKKSESSWEREPTSRKYYKTRPNAIGGAQKNSGAPAQRCPPRVFSLILSRRRVSVHAANLQDLPCKVVARRGAGRRLRRVAGRPRGRLHPFLHRRAGARDRGEAFRRTG